ncbi:MAG: hypothetical protein ABIP89_06525, partial [Polyangiaceae bacterium]
PHSAGSSSSTIILGVQSEEVGSAIGRVHIVASVNGAVASDETLNVVNGAPPVFPHEVKLVSTDASAKIDVKIEAYPPTGFGAPDSVILTRLAAGGFVAGETKLMRLRMEARCLVGLIGGLGGPMCAAPQTCESGRCADDTVLPQDLEDYEPNWAIDAPDICRPANHGAPEVIVGTGQTDFSPIADGQTLQAELGPQHGHHLWIAVRMRNLKQSGSTTTITGVQPGTNVVIPPTSFVFTFDADEGGYCKLYGLRYQLDNGGIDYKQFLGKPLDVNVEVRDVTGSTLKSVAHINVAPTVLGE